MPVEMWTPEAELALFTSMVGLRPVGIHRHFRMVNIYTRLLNRLGDTNISLGDIWQRLEELYNIALLNELEDEYEEEEEEQEKADQASDAGAEAGEQEGNDEGEQKLSEDDGGKGEGEDGEEDQGSEYGQEGNDRAYAGNDDDVGSSKDGAYATRRSSQGKQVNRNAPVKGAGTAINTSDPDFWRKAGAEFSLPWSEFGILMEERAGAGVPEDLDDMESVADAASVASTSKAPSPELESGDDRESSPVQKRRKGRSSTPVPRSRTKLARSTTSSTRKKPRTR